MESTICVDQKGIIEEVKDKSVIVRFLMPTACGNCSAKSICSAGKIDKDCIEIEDSSKKYSTGDLVRVEISKAMGYRALGYGYILPFFIVLLTLIIVTILGLNELFAGIISVLILFPYYLLLYMVRNQINRKFKFELKKGE